MAINFKDLGAFTGGDLGALQVDVAFGGTDAVTGVDSGTLIDVSALGGTDATTPADVGALTDARALPTYAPDAGRQIVLVEATPSLTLSGWSVYSGSAYQLTLSRFLTVGDEVLYRRVVGVRLDATDLTLVGSAAAVVSTASSWYWDEAAGTLYVRAPGGGSPATFTGQAFVTYHFATEGRVIAPAVGQPDVGLYYRPWVVGDLPRITRQISDILFGITIDETGEVTFSNGHGGWDYLIPGHNWRNKRVRILVGDYGDGNVELYRDDFTTVATMLIQDTAADEETATLQVASQTRLLSAEIPSGRFTVGDYPNLGEGVAGTAKRLGWGRGTIRPDLTDTSSHGVYTVADASKQTLFAIHSVVAIAKSNGGRTTLTLATHFTVDLVACTITLTGTDEYTHLDYDIECEVTGKPNPADAGAFLATFAEITRDILATHLSVADADFDDDSFDSAHLDAEAPLGVWLKEPRSIASIFSSSEPNVPSLERSVLGTIRQDLAGRWNLRVWNYGSPLTDVVLEKSDFARFSPEPKTETICSVARVYYARDHSTGGWSTAAAEDLSARYLAETLEEAEFYTFLVHDSDAVDHAARAMLLVSAASIEVEFEERGTSMASLLAGDFVTVSFAPAPVPGQAFVEAPLEVLRLDISLFPTLRISGRLGDVRSVQSRIGKVTDEDAPDWFTATPAQKADQGFVTDEAGLIDPSDPTTVDLSVVW